MKDQNGDGQWAIGLIIGVLIGALGIVFLIYFIARNPVVKNETKIQVMYDLNDPYTEVKVRSYLAELNVKYPNVALAQMKLESANGTSKVFREGNNLFGMKNPVRRPTTSLGERDNHAYYSHWRQSCIDYALYQAFVSNAENLASESEWLDFVGRVYAQDDSYKKKLVVIIKNLNKHGN